MFGVSDPTADGISANGPRYAVIKNGSVRGWNDGINLNSTYGLVDGVRSTNNSTGFRIGGGSEVSDCVATLNSEDGISVDFGVVRDCVVAENGYGIYVVNHSRVEDNRVHVDSFGISVAGSFNSIRNNDLTGSSSSDIQLAVSANSNAFIGNVYCDITVGGTNNIYTGNIDRTDAC